jgi:triacylglycerol lipase
MQILSNHFPRPRREKTGFAGQSGSQVSPRPVPHVIRDWKYLRPPCRKFPFFQGSPLHSFESNDLAAASWLADLCLLAYDDPPFFTKALSGSGLEWVDFIRNRGVEVYLVRSSSTLIVVFRGTQINNPIEFFKDIKTDLIFKPENSPHYPGKIHHGFEKALDQVWSPLSVILRKHTRIHFAGHSLGGALALLSALRTRCTDSRIHTFACPRVGDLEFAAAADQTDWIRYEIEHDMVPRLPPRKFGFAHAGKRHVITRTGQISLQPDPKREKAWKTNLKLNFFDHSPVLYATHLYNAMLKINK